MKLETSIPVKTIAGTAQLAGALAGSAWYRSARRIIDDGESGWYAFDFHGTTVATVSWIREAILALHRYARVTRPDIHLLCANLCDLVREELIVALQAANCVMIVARLDDDNNVINPTLVGQLDSALRETLDAIKQSSEVNAPMVTRTLPHVGLTAANNRLAALETKGILKSKKRGRLRIYRPIMENLCYGN